MGELIKQTLKRNKDIKHWIKFFNDDVISSIIQTTMEYCSGYKYEHFKNEIDVGYLVPTVTFYDVMHKVIDNLTFSNKFFNWYDNLNYDDMEEFNRFIKMRILEFTNK